MRIKCVAASFSMIAIAEFIGLGSYAGCKAFQNGCARTCDIVYAAFQVSVVAQRCGQIPIVIGPWLSFHGDGSFIRALRAWIVAQVKTNIGQLVVGVDSFFRFRKFGLCDFESSFRQRTALGCAAECNVDFRTVGESGDVGFAAGTCSSSRNRDLTS